MGGGRRGSVEKIMPGERRMSVEMVAPGAPPAYPGGLGTVNGSPGRRRRLSNEGVPAPPVPLGGGNTSPKSGLRKVPRDDQVPRDSYPREISPGRGGMGSREPSPQRGRANTASYARNADVIPGKATVVSNNDVVSVSELRESHEPLKYRGPALKGQAELAMPLPHTRPNSKPSVPPNFKSTFTGHSPRDSLPTDPPHFVNPNGSRAVQGLSQTAVRKQVGLGMLLASLPPPISWTPMPSDLPPRDPDQPASQSSSAPIQMVGSVASVIGPLAASHYDEERELRRRDPRGRWHGWHSNQLFVEELVPGYGAAMHGDIQEGDEVISINNVPVDTTEQVKTLTIGDEGTPCVVQIRRKGEVKDVHVTRTCPSHVTNSFVHGQISRSKHIEVADYQAAMVGRPVHRERRTGGGYVSTSTVVSRG
eukprot:CAMPEP_0173419914 /NCGR_PEP_ID=MMETSP1357-20121228/1585_1 /TAXON_ID=77926 /ORGANISM="Hemiselmis rufescens, Strain PCC563" /LENGTH=420 /DNA_ID=CAMNT_0014382635 /DNA_START=18 /DNA_END=1280 /DNA_ORIENTATION=-